MPDQNWRDRTGLVQTIRACPALPPQLALLHPPEEEGCCELLLLPRWGRESSQICGDRLMIIFQLSLFYIKIHKLSFILFQLSYIILSITFYFILIQLYFILFQFYFILFYCTLLFYFIFSLYSIL